MGGMSNAEQPQDDVLVVDFEDPAASVADAPHGVGDDFDQEIPDYVRAHTRRDFLTMICKGVSPKVAAKVHGLGNYESDPSLRALVEQCEAVAISMVEIRVHSDIVAGGKIATGVQFWLNSRAGYKALADRDDTEPQSVTLHRKIVKGPGAKEQAA